jgi:F-type H+-transporting ATPase subunit epsilon
MHLDVVTPKGRLLSEEVDEVTAPGVLGEFGVLPGHIPFLTGMRAGVLRWSVRGGGGSLAVGPGFVQVTAGDRVVVLADLGSRVGDIDATAARRELDEAQKQLDHWESEDEGLRAEVEQRKAWAQARLEAAASAPSAAH